jgi:L-xylulokinase
MADPRDMSLLGKTYFPDSARHEAYQTRYELHCKLAAALAPFWPEIEALVP